jgi:hypothetical protein
MHQALRFTRIPYPPPAIALASSGGFVDTLPGVSLPPPIDVAEITARGVGAEHARVARLNGIEEGERSGFMKGWRAGVFHGAFGGVLVTLLVLKFIATVLT